MPASATPPHTDSQAIEGLLRQAITHHQAGRILEAGQLYQAILQTHPGHPEANHNLGVVAVQGQQAEAGLAYLAAAIEADPTRGRYWVSYIDALCHSGRQDEARSVLALASQQGLEGEEVDALAARMGAAGQTEAGVNAAQECSAVDAPEVSTATQGALPSRNEVDALLVHFNAGRLAEALNLAKAMTRRFPSHAFGWKALGAVLKTLGNNADAVDPMRKAVTLSPDDAEAHYNLGVVLLQLGRPEEAETSFRRALELCTGYADARLNLGVALNQMRRMDEAEDCLREAVRIRPDSAAAHGNLGAVLDAQGRLDEAEASYRQAVAIRPDAAEGHFGLGRILRMRGRLAESEASLARSLAIDPNNARAHAELAQTLRALERLEDADRHYLDALRLDPHDKAAHGNRGNLLCQMERLVEAEFCYRMALEIDPNDAGLYANLGKLLKNRGRLEEAEQRFRQALQIDPDDLEIHNRLALVLQDRGRPDEAEVCYRRILQADSGNVGATNNLGRLLMGLGRLGEAADCFRQVLDAAPDLAFAHSSLLYVLTLNGAVNERSLFAEHLRFGERFEALFRAEWPAHTNVRDPERRLQVGFVSSDFYNHAVASFIEPVLASLAGHPAFSLHAYYNHFIRDSVTERLRGYFAHWHPVAELTDAVLAERIGADGIDILIDLSGHTANNRLMTFARRPAPIQASWIGYPGTTGLSAMDYYLADRFVLPPGKFDDQFTEKIVRLPANAPFLPLDTAPPVNALPALSNGYVTFGSFNRRDKLSREVVALWSRLLRALPGSRMLLGGLPEAGRSDVLRAWFAEEGIAPERLIFHPRSGMEAYLRLHHAVDICLDTFPYNGGTTTHHALWMGVPTLTLAGADARSRVGVAILSQCGLPDFAVAHAEDFVARGVHWARHLDALADLRSGLREQVRRSPSRKPEIVAAGLAQALRIVWQRWCAGIPPESLDVHLHEVSGMLRGDGT